MVSFDSRVAGTPAAAWDDARLRRAPLLDTSRCPELIVFAAHPDDETLGAAGVMMNFAQRGLPVHVVVVTDGGATGEAGIAARRSAELAGSMAVLASDARITELGFADSRTPDDRSEIAERIAAIIRTAAPTALLVSPWVGDGHRDHRVVAELITEQASGRRVIAYPIWMWHWSDPSDPALPWPQFRTLDVDPAVKARAIAAFPSQIDGQDPTLRPEMLEHFLAEREVYIELGPESNDPPELGADYFEELHRRRDDPWRFLTRWYEERKRAIVLSGLLERRYGSALEVGCSIGVLTSGLADRCDELLAVDISAAAVHSAQQRVGARARVEQVDVSEQFPSGPFDLIVLSEVGYYFSAARLDALLVAARDALNPNGELVACHWRHPVENYPLLGDEVHRRIGMLGLPRLVRHEEDDFLFEVFSNDDRSVGRREGLA